MKKIMFLFLTVLMAFMAYGQKNVYFNSDFEGHPFANIKQIAILPVTTPISSRDVNVEHLRHHQRTTISSQDLNSNQLKQLQTSRALEFQNDIYSSLLEMNEMHDKIQNIRITNATLNKHQIGLDSIGNYTPKELAKILNVDAIVYSSVTKRISGYSRHSSNIIHCVISLNNNSNTQIWQYNISEAKSDKKSEDNLIATILKKAMKEFPAAYQPEAKTSKFSKLFKRKK